MAGDESLLAEIGNTRCLACHDQRNCLRLRMIYHRPILLAIVLVRSKTSTIASLHIRGIFTCIIYPHLRSYHLVYVDESGCDKGVRFRRTGWSPLGVTPLQVTQFRRGQRYQILPAYSQDGILLARVL